MEKTVNIHTAKTELSRLIAEVEGGGEVVIARAGKPVAKLVALNKVKAPKRPSRKAGFLKGKIWVGPNFDDPLPKEIMKAFRGEDD